MTKYRVTEMNRVASLLLWLGHGRALEANFVFIKFVLAFTIWFDPHLDMITLNDLQWFIPRWIIALPFAIVAMVQLIGLVLNIRGYECNWIFRAVGASMGITLWFWIIIKSFMVGSISTGMASLAITAIPSSAFLLWKAINRLPIPGKMGMV